MEQRQPPLSKFTLTGRMLLLVHLFRHVLNA